MPAQSVQPTEISISPSTVPRHRVANSAATAGRQQVNGAVGRRRVDRDFFDAGSRLPSNLRTNLLPPAEEWGPFESAGWYANCSVWWARRIVPGVRNGDRDRVLKFLQDESIVGEVNTKDEITYFAPVSSSYLETKNIKKKFWWISQQQVDRLSAWLMEEARAFPASSRTNELVEDALYDKLFS